MDDRLKDLNNLVDDMLHALGGRCGYGQAKVYWNLVSEYYNGQEFKEYIDTFKSVASSKTPWGEEIPFKAQTIEMLSDMKNTYDILSRVMEGDSESKKRENIDRQLLMSKLYTMESIINGIGNAAESIDKFYLEKI